MALRSSSLEMDRASRVQILDEVVCISFRINTLAKGIDPNLLLYIAIGKY